MRADRLISMVLFMQSRGQVTAAELAAELEVSVATARRDLEALSAAGVPVYPQPGRGGGWALVGGARTDLSGLSAGEAQALFRLAGPAAVSSVSGEARSALRKLVQALPPSFRESAEAAAAATKIDRAGWGGVVRERPPLVGELQTAVVQRRRVQLAYRSVRGPSERTVEPLGLVDKDDVWYLIAGTAHGQRTFRVDRISSATPLAQTFARPADFDLDAAWQRVSDEMEARRSRTWATVLVPARFADILQDHFGRHCVIEAELDDGRARVRVGAPQPRDIAQHLAGWGSMVTVLDPPAVQAELARIGAELTALYAS